MILFSWRAKFYTLFHRNVLYDTVSFSCLGREHCTAGQVIELVPCISSHAAFEKAASASLLTGQWVGSQTILRAQLGPP